MLVDPVEGVVEDLGDVAGAGGGVDEGSVERWVVEISHGAGELVDEAREPVGEQR